MIPNAGFQHVAPIEDFPEDRWDAVIALLLTSPFLFARYARPHLIESRAAASSRLRRCTASWLPLIRPRMVGQARRARLVKTLALEGAEHGISVSAVCPSYVRTPLVEGQIADQATT